MIGIGALTGLTCCRCHFALRHLVARSGNYSVSIRNRIKKKQEGKMLFVRRACRNKPCFLFKCKKNIFFLQPTTANCLTFSERCRKCSSLPAAASAF